MMNIKNNCILLSSIILLGSLGANTAHAAPPEDIMQKQQQIIAQKEQELASKRAEQSLQHRVSQSMTKTQQQESRLEVFVLPEEENSFKIKKFYLKADRYARKFE